MNFSSKFSLAKFGTFMLKKCKSFSQGSRYVLHSNRKCFHSLRIAEHTDSLTFRYAFMSSDFYIQFVITAPDFGQNLARISIL